MASKASPIQKRTTISNKASVRRYASSLTALVAWGNAKAGSGELRRATSRVIAALQDVGFVAEDDRPFEDETLRTQLRDSFQHAFGSLVWWVPREALPLTVASMMVKVDQTTRNASPVYKGPWRSLFWFGVAEVMRHTIHLLSTCRGCGRAFVRRGRQEYCDKACAGRVRSKKWYAANRETAAERQHEAYVARRRRIHSKARVARHPRAVRKPK